MPATWYAHGVFPAHEYDRVHVREKGVTGVKGCPDRLEKTDGKVQEYRGRRFIVSPSGRVTSDPLDLAK